MPHPAPISARATIDVTNVATGAPAVARVTTAANGIFRVVDCLRPGQYRVIVRALGFAPKTLPVVELTAARLTNVDVGLWSLSPRYRCRLQTQSVIAQRGRSADPTGSARRTSCGTCRRRREAQRSTSCVTFRRSTSTSTTTSVSAATRASPSRSTADQARSRPRSWETSSRNCPPMRWITWKSFRIPRRATMPTASPASSTSFCVKSPTPARVAASRWAPAPRDTSTPGSMAAGNAARSRRMAAIPSCATTARGTRQFFARTRSTRRSRTSRKAAHARRSHSSTPSPARRRISRATTTNFPPTRCTASVGSGRRTASRITLSIRRWPSPISPTATPATSITRGAPRPR